MMKLQEKIEVLDNALNLPDVYSKDPKKAADFARLRTKLAGDLEKAEADWLTAQELLETL